MANLFVELDGSQPVAKRSYGCHFAGCRDRSCSRQVSCRMWVRLSLIYNVESWLVQVSYFVEGLNVFNESKFDPADLDHLARARPKPRVRR